MLRRDPKALLVAGEQRFRELLEYKMVFHHMKEV